MNKGGNYSLRVLCSFKCSKLPTTYNMLFVSLIKKSIETASEEYFNKMYYYGEKANKKSKNYTFSVFLSGFTRKSHEFLIEDEVRLFVSSPDVEWIFHFYNGLTKLDTFVYQGYQLEKKRIHMLQEKKLSESLVVCQTMSPIHICNKNKQSLSPDVVEFQQEFDYISELTVKNFRDVGLSSSVRFIPLQMKKVVIKESIRGFKEKTALDHMFLEGYKGTFALEGQTEDLEILYQLGLGFRRSSGWGMFEVIHS